MKGPAWVFVVTCVTTGSLFRNAESLHCFTCTNLTNDDDCRRVSQCADNEICFVQRVHRHNATTYTSGCINSQHCPNHRQFTIVGRSVNQDCKECCSHDGCNKDLCEIREVTATESPNTCEDDPSTNCSRVSALVNLCSNRQEAKQLCPRYCGLCNQVDGGWSVWGNWSSCSGTCGIATKTRSRTCSHPAPQHGGAQCPGNHTLVHACFDRPCPVHGGWNVWGSWEGCSSPCGIGINKRHRFCNNPSPTLYGRYCQGDPVDYTICTGHDCENTTTTTAPTKLIPHCFDSSSDCALLNQTIGLCSTPQNAQKVCPQFCGLCSTADGYWAGWSSWGTCSTTCGNGTWTKTRLCSNPVPSKGGNPCSGSSTDTGVCNIRQCPVHGSWSMWGKWSTCSASCGQGLTHRRRTCTNPRPSYNGNYCFDDPLEYAQCLVMQCSVDGGWSEWLLWSSCSVTCGAGQMTRQRFCSNPRPENGGHICTGTKLEHKNCQPGPCAVDGGWSEWLLWSSCSVTCGAGQMTRQRLCSNPRPENGGHICTGTKLEHKNCQPGPCAVDGGWMDWSVWGSCSATCGAGQMTRQRQCLNPRPEHGGRNCTGNSLEHKTCHPGQCTDYNTPTVVFNAHHVTNLSPPTGQPVVFTIVISNIGNGYSSSTGKFTAPVNGTYSFTVQLCVRNGHGADFSLVLDGTTITNFHDYDHGGYTTSSTTVPLFLKQGQKVWVTPASRCSSCLTEDSYCWNRFSGSLIHK